MKRNLPVALCLLASAACSGGAGTSGTSGTGGGSATGGATTSGSGGIDPIGLWFGGQADLDASALGGTEGTPSLTAYQAALPDGEIQVAGDRTARTVAFRDTCPLPTSSTEGTGPGAEAFDGQGNLWVRYPGDRHIFEWSASQLLQSCLPATPTLAVDLPTVGDFTSMVFDGHGNLWGSYSEDSEIYGIRAADLGATGSVDATWEIQSYGGGTTAALYTPVGLAFDSAGNLWVGNYYSILAFTPATLAAAYLDGGGSGPGNTRPQGDLQITNAPAMDYELDAGGGGPGYGAFQYQYLAFSAAGDLWVSVATNLPGATPGNEILMFTAAQLGTLSSNSEPAPAYTIGEGLIDTGSGTFVPIPWAALAFDAAGDLWASALVVQPSLYRFSPGALADGGAPDIILSIPPGVDPSYSMAFNPIPAGLPIQP
jgi:hypothetical protein